MFKLNIKLVWTIWTDGTNGEDTDEVMSLLCCAGLEWPLVLFMHFIQFILYCKRQSGCRKQGPDPRTLLLPESPFFWAMEQVPCLVLSVCGTVTSCHGQGCSYRPARATPGTVPSAPGERHPNGVNLAAEGPPGPFSDPAHEKLAFVAVILHLRRTVPRFLLDSTGLEL